MFRSLFCLLVLALSLAGQARAFASDCVQTPDCSSIPYNSCLYSRVPQITISMRRDTTCEIAFTIGRATTEVAHNVLRRPRHGKVGKANRYAFAYRPDAGFVGSDSFSIKAEGVTSGARMEHVFEIVVTVTP